MITKFSIDYRINPHHNKHVATHRTDDPVEAEEFLMHLLATGARILTIKHEGAELDESKTTQMLRVAAERVASMLLRTSLDLDAPAVKHRFGFMA